MNITAEIINLIPILFHRLRALGDELHRDHDVTTPMRGVLMSLNDYGPQTVPYMAAARPVSRQHIQTQVDALLKRRLVQVLPNPRHKRSSLIDLTDQGGELVLKMRQSENKVISNTLGRFAHSDLEIVQKVLSGFAEQLQTEIQK